MIRAAQAASSLGLFVLFLFSAQRAVAQDAGDDENAEQATQADSADQQSAQDSPDAEPVQEIPAEEPPPKAKLPFGYLSDPAVPPENLYEAFFTGKIYFNNRFRVELADTTGLDSSTAITNRIRLGYETKPFYGLSGFIEMENVATPDQGNYSVPATGGGTPTRTPIADPPGTEVNQAYARFNVDSIGESGISLDLKAGKERIILDDHRFVGNVGWRQFEQTFDAVAARSNLGVDGLSLFYAYVWGVQRIFGPDGPNWDSDSHLANLSYRVMPELTITPFAYLLDFRSDSPLNSVNSYGIRLTGDIARDSENEADLYFDYEASYARQTDAGPNPLSFDVDFVGLQGRVIKQGLGNLALGYQLLGSDNGIFGFRFPLGTNHKFQGFADQFLTTPAFGLQDLYLSGALNLPHGITPSLYFHQFWSDVGGTDLGFEIDFVVNMAITKHWSFLVKGAYFDGHNGQPDTTRVWFETTILF